MLIDAFEFARQSGEVSGSLPASSLRRLGALGGDTLQWAAIGSIDREGRPFITLKVDGAVEIECQRCMEEMSAPVHIEARFLVASSDAEADSIPVDEDDFDVVVGSDSFDLVALVEDEVILSIPSVPKHVVCPGAAQENRQQLEAVEVENPNPFAVLAGLKTGKKES